MKSSRKSPSQHYILSRKTKYHADTPRIPPLTDAETTLPQRLLLSAIRRIGGLNAENLWRLLLRNFRLMRGMLSFASKMMPNGELARREEIIRAPLGADAPDWHPQQQAIIQACDEMHAERLVSDETWRALKQHFNDRLLLELLMLIGYYEGLAGVLNSTGLTLDDALEWKLASLTLNR